MLLMNTHYICFCGEIRKTSGVFDCEDYLSGAVVKKPQEKLNKNNVEQINVDII